MSLNNSELNRLDGITKKYVDYIYGLLFKGYTNYFDFSSGSITTITASNTFYLLNCNTTSIFSNNGLSASNNRVTNIDNSTKVVKMEGIISLSSGNNNVLHAAFFKNGTLLPCSEQSSVASPSGRMGNIPFHCLVSLDLNDYVEVYVKNVTTSGNITIENINVIITEI